jgi:hypothetical protein
VDIDSFSDAAPEVRKETSPAVAEKSVVAEVVVRTESPAAAEPLLLRSLLLIKPPPNSAGPLSALFKGATTLPNMFLWSKFGRSSPKTRRPLLP